MACEDCDCWAAKRSSGDGCCCGCDVVGDGPELIKDMPPLMSMSIAGAKDNESDCPGVKPREDTGVLLDSGPAVEKKASEAASRDEGWLPPICDISKAG